MEHMTSELAKFITSNENSVLIAAILFLLLLTLYGHYRGFVRMAVSLASAVVSFFLVKWILPFFTDAAEKSGFFAVQAERFSDSLFQGGAAEYSDFYTMLGLDQAAEAAGEFLSGIFINVVCFILLFIIVNILFKIAAHFLNLLMRLPILNGINQLGGAAVGFCEGIFYLWIVMIVIAFTPAAQLSQAILPQIFANGFLTWIYQNNFLLNILAGFFGMG